MTTWQSLLLSANLWRMLLSSNSQYKTLFQLNLNSQLNKDSSHEVIKINISIQLEII